jgi:hypothetical protein
MADALAGIGTDALPGTATKKPTPRYSWAQFPNSTTGLKSGQLPVKDEGALSGLTTSMTAQQPQGYEQAQGLTEGMMSGAAYQPYRAQQQESFARAAKNLRAQQGAYNAPQIGQGAAVQAQQGVEQNIVEGLGETNRQMAMDEQAMKERGLSAFGDLQGERRTEETFQTGQWEKTWGDALLYNDPTSEQGLTTLQDMYEQRYGYRPDMKELQNEREYIRTKREQDVDSYEWEKEKWNKTFGLDEKQFDEMTRQFNINTAEGSRQFNEKMKLDWEGLSQQDRQFFEGLGFDKQKWTDTQDNWQQEFDFTVTKWGEESQQRWAEIKNNYELTKMNIVSGETIAGMKISSDEKIAGMQLDSAELIAANRDAIEREGLSLQEASLKGYTLPDGTVVKGSLQIAGEELGIKQGELSVMQEELKKKYDLLTTDQKIRATELFGGTDPITGRPVKGSLEIENDKVDIQKTLADAETKRVSLATDALYGYTDANGNVVKGTAQIAQGMFDLESDQVELQKDEVYGYKVDAMGRREGNPGYDADTARTVKGKYDMMNDAEQRAADELYGYTDEETGISVKGTLELQGDAVAIQQQGMSLQDAALKGYYTTDENGNSVWVKGSGLIDMEKAGYDSKLASAQLDSMHGYYKLDANGKPTNEYIKGSIQIGSEALGLQAQTLEEQKKELWGWTERGPNGEFIADHKGKYDMMSDADKRESDRLYGAWTKGPNNVLTWMPGEHAAQVALIQMQQEFALQGINLQNVFNNIENLAPDQVAQLLVGAAEDAGIEYQAKNADGTPMVDSRGNPVMRPGIEDLDPPAAQANAAVAGIREWMSTDDAGRKGKMVEGGDATSKILYDAIKSGNQDVIGGLAVGSIPSASVQGGMWTVTDRENRGVLTDDGKQWVTANKGRLIAAKDGKVYRVKKYSPTSKKNGESAIIVTDVATGLDVKITRMNDFNYLR